MQAFVALALIAVSILMPLVFVALGAIYVVRPVEVQRFWSTLAPPSVPTRFGRWFSPEATSIRVVQLLGWVFVLAGCFLLWEGGGFLLESWRRP